jgi:hypothetical protein
VDDGTLFAIGCAVTFLALGGAYVYMRDYLFELRTPFLTEKDRTALDEPAREGAVQRQVGRA